MYGRIITLAGIFLFLFLAVIIGLSFSAGRRQWTQDFSRAPAPSPSAPAALPAIPEASPPASSLSPALPSAPPAPEAPEPQLQNPPRVVKAMYATNWSAGNAKRLAYFLDLLKRTELNAIVIDIKDYSGVVGYDTAVPLAYAYHAAERRISDLAALVRRLHAEGVYVIGRIAVFQDQKLAAARPDLALKRGTTTPEAWRDDKGLMWVDPASQDAWDYHVALAKDVLRRGVDEINFDYVRFPSDGPLEKIAYPVWDGKQPRTIVMRNFFKYLAEHLPGAALSADLFGLSTVNTDDLGIGQHLESVVPYFSAVAPMMYPSHYHAGFLGFANPAAHPYAVVRYSTESALRRMEAWKTKGRSTTTPEAVPAERMPSVTLRPWLQDFNLGAAYDAEKVREEIQAVYDAFCGAEGIPVATSTPTATTTARESRSCDDHVITSAGFGGWMLWNPANLYTAAALKVE